MERNGGSPATERSSDDLIAGRSSPDGGTSIIVEATAEMRIGGESAEAYPERQGVDDCEYYLRTGSCGFGERCRFNHPPDRNSALGVMRDKGGEYPERIDQVVCQYYMRTEMCKFGASCKYHHPRQGDGLTSSLVALNLHGYPLRLGAKECTYYLRTGQCKFGAGCRFHHPQPRAVQILEPMPLSIPLLASSVYPTVQSPAISSHQYGVVPGEWPVARSSLIPGSYVPDTYRSVMHPQGILPLPGWNPYQAAVTSGATLSAPSNAGAGPVYGIQQLPSPVPTYGGAYLSMPPLAGPSGFSLKEHAFPERPGEPECQHFMRTGDCKFGSSCKYHHPAPRSRPSTNFDLSTMDFPQRPGAPLCSQYALTGVCYFGGSCEYDQPMKTLSFSPSVLSIPDMAVAPYPLGSSMPTLGTSSSLVELSAAVGSIFSKNKVLPQSSIQQPPGESSTPSADISGTCSVREAHTSS